MAKTAKWRRRLNLSKEQGWKCWWCGCAIVEGADKSGKPTANMATLDHIYGKFDPRRHEPHRGERRAVLACYACNQRRRHEPRLGTDAGVTISKDAADTTSP
jgi:hypothetical protein